MLNLTNTHLTPEDAMLEAARLREADQGLSIPASQALRISNRLQTTLELGLLIDMFAAEMSRLLQFNAVCYENPAFQYQHQVGENATHSVRYRLSLPDLDQLGSLTLKRTRPFTILDTRIIEFGVTQLVYPLRNAVLYRIAQEAASKDALTGVNNRTFFDSTLQREVDLAKRHGTRLSLLCVDIDHFKQVNDNYGHSTGDRVLKFVADGLQSCVRASDVVFRYGGEEFVVLLSNTEWQGAMLLAERIRERIASCFITHRGFPIAVTVSLGVTALESEDTRASLFERADAALYEAKRSGRNRVVRR